MASSSAYDNWSREELVSRILNLEKSQAKGKQPQHKGKPFDFSAHPRRKIALKFCYSGWEYSGLAYQKTGSPLPTVEGTIYDALVKARLVDPEAGFEGCGWEKCGRTDRGVSAAGQVISLWVRSALGSFSTDTRGTMTEPTTSNPLPSSSASSNADPTPGLEIDFGDDDIQKSNSSIPKSSSSKPKLEHDYLAILNRLLPDTIRILAWSPVSDSFSARFSCTYRHYKYFFSAYTAPRSTLDIDLMRKAASRLIGEHDFRNLCKLDPGKQITSFRRKVLRAYIDPLTQSNDDMYVFNLIGSAFLYHQVRHIMAVLFLAGSGLEDPSVVSALLNVEEGLETDPDSNTPLPVVSAKPDYQMADGLPLMLWECGYPDGVLDWRTNGREESGETRSDGVAESVTELYQRMHATYSRSQVYTTLNDHFCIAASAHHLRCSASSPLRGQADDTGMLSMPLGGGTYGRRAREKYVPLLQRNRLDPVEVANKRWRLGKGLRRNERRLAAEQADEDDDDGDE